MKFENSRLIRPFASLFIIALIAGLSQQAIDEDSDFKKTCFRPLVETYSMQGLEKPEEVSLKMCSSIQHTCCQVQDQETMFTNWIHGKEEENIQEHFHHNAQLYTELIKEIIQIQEHAAHVKSVIVKKVSNCKLLAERINSFEFAQVAKKIEEHLINMKEFFVKVYEGFYCAICNHDNHRFFKKDTMTMIFSEKFCRDIIEETLQSLLMFHVDIIKPLNLITKFVTSCDMKGEYNLESSFPKELVFAESKETTFSLESCRDHRNKREWFSYCKDVCMNFRMVKFSKYFEPNIDEIPAYIAFLKKKNTEMTVEKTIHAMNEAKENIGGKKAGKGHRRVLEEEEGHDSGSLIYRPGLSPKVQLDAWTIDFQAEGISLLKESDGASITETSYNTVKTELQLARDGSSTQASSMLTSDEKEMIRLAGKRDLSNAGILNAMLFVLTLFLLK